MTSNNSTFTRTKGGRKPLLSAAMALALCIAYVGLAGQAEAARPVNDPEEVKQILVQEAHVNSVVPPALALAVAKVESDFRAGVSSSAGARGVMQIMPATGWGEFGVTADELWDPRTNVRVGIAFLERLYRAYGDWHLVLSHYNGGSLKRRGGQYVPHDYTRKYVANVMHWWTRFERSTVVAALEEATPSPEKTVSSRSGNPNSNWTTKSDKYQSGYWVLQDPAHHNNWKDYLATADLWLHRIEKYPSQNSKAVTAEPHDEPLQPRFTLNSPNAYRPLVPRFQ